LAEREWFTLIHVTALSSGASISVPNMSQGEPMVTQEREGREKSLRYAGRGIGLAWAMFWTMFGLASGIGEGMNVLGVLLHMAFPGLAFLASVAVAWKWEAPGGVLLLAEGVLVLLLYALLFTTMAFRSVIFIYSAMALPPLVAGALLLLSLRRPTMAGQEVR
jgi:hypothetical protein